MTLRQSLLLASAVLALAGCGGKNDKAAASPDVKPNGAAYSSVDVCTLATDDELKAALGENSAGKERRDTDDLKACAIDGTSGDFYLFITVSRPSLPAAEQVSYDKGAAPGAKDIDGTTFSFADETGGTQAYVETSDGELVLRASFVYYVDSGKITDAPAVVQRLHALLGQITQKI